MKKVKAVQIEGFGGPIAAELVTYVDVFKISNGQMFKSEEEAKQAEREYILHAALEQLKFDTAAGGTTFEGDYEEGCRREEIMRAIMCQGPELLEIIKKYLE